MSECRRCGHCCLFGGVYATKEDVERWLQQGRYDILQCLNGNPWRWPETFDNAPYTLEVEIDTQNVLGNHSFEMKVRQKFRQIAEEMDADVDLWFDPVTGEEFNVCPFLRKVRGNEMFECLIHKTKPELCLDYRYDPVACPHDFKEVYKQYTQMKRRDRFRVKKLFS